MSPHIPSHRAFRFAAVLMLVSAIGACDDQPEPVPPPGKQAAAKKASKTKKDTNQSIALEGWRIPTAPDLTAPSGDWKRQHLEVSEPERFGECHEFLDRSAAPKKRLPYTGAELDVRLFGCDVAAQHRAKDRLYLAYSVPDSEHEGTDLRMSVYDTTGSPPPLLWSHRMDRREHSHHFEANLRESFIAPIPPNVACFGTLWAGGTQVACLSYDGEKVEWTGTMNFWSPVRLQPGGGGLVGADVSGLTRRYPFSGVEMEHHPLPGRGGHSALYTVVNDTLVYAPEPPMSDDTYEHTLSAWHLDNFEAKWRRKLPARVDPVVNDLVFEPYVLIKIGEKIVAVNADTGESPWAVRVGSDRPKAAVTSETLHLLIRRRKTSNLLYAMDIHSGDIQWFARTPTGSLNVAAVGDSIALKSIHAVERVQSIQQPPEGAPAINSTAPDGRARGYTTETPDGSGDE